MERVQVPKAAQCRRHRPTVSCDALGRFHLAAMNRRPPKSIDAGTMTTKRITGA